MCRYLLIAAVGQRPRRFSKSRQYQEYFHPAGELAEFWQERELTDFEEFSSTFVGVMIDECKKLTEDVISRTDCKSNFGTIRKRMFFHMIG